VWTKAMSSSCRIVYLRYAGVKTPLVKRMDGIGLRGPEKITPRALLEADSTAWSAQTLRPLRLGRGSGRARKKEAALQQQPGSHVVP
jgi:hypothetical protein